MSRKPGSMYRYARGQATTRREYMGGVPTSRISQFDMGKRTGKFPLELSLISEEAQQIRHNSLEAGRISANRFLEKNVGVTNYRLRIRVYPHIVLRENKQATGAGADRVSQGMRASYGKNVSTAARVKQNQVIMTVETDKINYPHAKEALRKAGMKFAAPYSIKIERGA
ncbi:MAG: 50S ribosomal protein L16 [Candidatus Thermoplasmatota archaeon]|nr:50S ribosomal protein L16 [Candidatus Thermoplasmatota archaeon]MBU1940273.1 50S ribosomal protein L16 [Candidatus Thermoplasmatota archaeon]